MSARVRVAVAFLRAEKRGLELRMGEPFDPVLSRRLEAITAAIETLGPTTCEDRAA